MSKLRLYPDPEPLSTPPTWEDVERLAVNYPSAHAVVSLVERGDLTREQALVSLVHWFATAFSRQFKREADARDREVLDTIVTERCGCSTVTYRRRRVQTLPCPAHAAQTGQDKQDPEQNAAEPPDRQA